MTTDPKDAEIARLTAELFEMTRSRDEWRNDFRALEKAIVGDTGLSAMTVAVQARLFRPRTEKAEAKVITLTEQVDAIAAHRDEVMAERDAALAQVAGAYEAAAQITENDKTLHEWEHTAAIRALTPAHALAARDRRDVQIRAETFDAVRDFIDPQWMEEAEAAVAILAAAEKEAPDAQ